MPRSSLRAGEERRGLALADASIAIPDQGPDAGRRFAGYAAVFNSRTAIGNPRTWGFYEEIAPGAFTKTIAEGDQRFLLNHNSDYVISRVSAGTLRLAQDGRGLPVDSHLDDELSYVRDMKVNLRNGNLTGMSFGFTVPEGKDEWRTETIPGGDGGDDAEVEVRTIREAKLIEVSAVTFPAYEETTAGLRHSLVPALLGRGDAEAIRRAAAYRPDLAALLGYDPASAPTRIDLKAARRPPVEKKSAPMSEPGEPTYPSDVEVQASVDEHAEIQGWTNYNESEEAAETNSAEPVASTRAPSQHELAKARLLVLRSRMRRTA